jgi:glutamine amidotransferase
VNVALFDYGVGNLHSLGKALEGGGATVAVTTDWAGALAADALVLPGVGAFSAAVEALPEDPAPIRRALEGGLPCLGICLGMQLLFDDSEEGEGSGIGMVPGSVVRIEAEVVPQMGWNDVETSSDPLFRGVEGLAAYYANSYVCRPDEPAHAIAWSTYDGGRLTAAVRRGNTWGVQFHPEKSSRDGRHLIANFLKAAQAANDRPGAGARSRRGGGA